MDQFIVEDFNRTTLLQVLDEKRIKNLVANAKLGKASITDMTKVTISFTTMKKNKQPQIMAYTMNLSQLTQEQQDIITKLVK